MAEAPVPGAREVVPAATVLAAWDSLAASIQREVDAGPCILLGILLGGIVPLVKVSERLRGDFLMDYCHLTRYLGGTTGGEIRWTQPPRVALGGATVILLDDIFDEGHTLAELRRHCLAGGAARVVTAVLARKRHGRPIADIVPDHVGVEVADQYVFGCGMDYHERWRHLDSIWAI